MNNVFEGIMSDPGYYIQPDDNQALGELISLKCFSEDWKNLLMWAHYADNYYMKFFLPKIPDFKVKSFTLVNLQVGQKLAQATGLFSIKETIERVFMESDKVPKHAKRLLRDAKFYKACNSKSVA